jgi:hypothetical protein
MNMLNDIEYAFVVVIASSTCIYITKWSKLHNIYTCIKDCEVDDHI